MKNTELPTLKKSTFRLVQYKLVKRVIEKCSFQKELWPYFGRQLNTRLIFKWSNHWRDQLANKTENYSFRMLIDFGCSVFLFCIGSTPLQLMQYYAFVSYFDALLNGTLVIFFWGEGGRLIVCLFSSDWSMAFFPSPYLSFLSIGRAPSLSSVQIV